MPETKQSQVAVAGPAIRTPQQEQARKEELLKKVRVLRETMHVNRAKVTGGKPDKTYIWVGRDDNMRTYFEGLGYAVCRDTSVKTQWKREDGTHARGDLVLYEVDKELYEALKAESELRGLEQLQSSKSGFQDFAAKSGVPVNLMETT